MDDTMTKTASAAQRPPSFEPDVKPAATVETTVANALAASQFVFEARCAEGEWPMPAMSAVACDVLSRMLTEAWMTSSTFGRLHHEMKVLPHEVERVDQALSEILGLSFAMPVEGGTHPVPMIDSAVLRPGLLRFSVNDTYAAYLKSVGAIGPSGVDLEVDIEPASLLVGNVPIPIDDSEFKLLVESARKDHFRRVGDWNFHAAERLSNGQLPEPPSAFGIPQMLALIHKLGAEPSGIA